MVDVFLLKTLLKLLKMLPKLNICEKKEKQFWKTCYTTNFSIFAKEKKTSPFSLKDLCKIYFVQKTKRTFLKTSCCRLAYKKEKKNKAFVYKASTSMTKLCSFCLRQSLHMAKKKNREHLPLEKKTALSGRVVFSSNFPK